MKSAILAVLLLSGAAAAQAAPRIRFGGIVVGGGYTHYAGPYWGGPWCCGYYGYGWDPYFYHPYYHTGFLYGAGMGEVKLRAHGKDAEVFLDGAFAGTAGQRKSMWLKPGAYNLEVRENGKQTYTRRIYVLSGKALRIDADRGGNR